MAQAVAPRTVLSDSLLKTRPEFKSYLMSSCNVGGTDVSQIQRKRVARQMKFPRLQGRQDVDSFKDVKKLSDIGYKKWNDEGDHRPDAPYRSCDNILDPVSGFVSTCGDVDRATGHTRIQSLHQLNHTPQANTPQGNHSVRVNSRGAPPETQRQTENDPGTPYAWNSRKVLDSSIRAELGGWTSDTPQTIAASTPFGNQLQYKRVPTDEAAAQRDKLAQRYMYTSSTQRSYEAIPWDTMLPAKRWPPTKTLEDRPDMISQLWTNKRYEPSAEEWQNTGRSWDWFQRRRGYYKNGPMDVVFCSPCSRTQQIPLYGGSIGATNLEEIDNAKEPFDPLTVKRVNIPRPSDTSHRPHIPGFAGATLYRSQTAPPTGVTPDPNTSTNLVYRPMPVSSNTTKREGPLSKMVTTVPPCNPFNKVNWTEVKVS